MKLTKTIIVCLLIGLTLCSEIKVGFYMANIEGFNYSVEESKKIVGLLTKSQNDKTTEEKYLLKPEDVGDVNPGHDVLLFSFQETNYDFSFDLKKILKDDEWTCHNALIKKGFTHFSKKLTYTYVCYKKKKFTVSFEKNAGLVDWGMDLKEAIGVCLKEKENAKGINYCFIGSHLDTNLETGAKIVNTLYKSMNTKFDKKNYIFYIIGDLNLRTWLDIDESNVDDVLKSNVDRKSESRKAVKDGDALAMAGLKEIIVNNNPTAKFEFCGVSNVYKLPFTYNYVNPTEEDLKQIKDGQLDKEHVLKKKPATKGKKVNNLGWLDRLACGYAANLSSCNIKGDNESVQYFAVPFLRKADHMPVLGHFTISTDSSTKRKLK